MKGFHILLILLTLTNISYSQQYKWTTGGGSDNNTQISKEYDKPKYICSDENKNIYILTQVGDHNIKADTFSLTQSSNTGLPYPLIHILFASYDCNGNMRFAKLIESNDHNIPYGLLYTNGNIYIAGRLWGLNKRIGNDWSLSTNNYRTTFLTKFDTSGTHQWTSFLGPYVNTTYYGPGETSTLSEDGLGNIHLITSLKTEVQITPSITSHAGTYDIKFDVNGNILNATYLQMADTNYFIKKSSIDKANGKIYCLFERNQVSSTNSKTIIAVFNNNGTQLWLDTTGLGSSVTSFRFIEKDGIYLCGNGNGGQTFSLGGKTAIHNLGFSVILKLDTSGYGKWIYQVNGSNPDMELNDLEIMPDNTIALTGMVGGTTKYKGRTISLPFGELNNPFLLQIDTSGNIVFMDQLHGTGLNNNGYIITSDKAGSLYVSGQFENTITAGNLSPYVVQNGNADFFIAKYGYDCSCTGLEPKSISSFNVAIKDTVNKSIQFTFTGTTPADSIIWDFGDGKDTALSNPTHQYPSIGTYTVCAKVYTQCNKSMLCKDVTIPPPVGITPITFDKNIKIYPNPLNDILIVEALTDRCNIRISDVMGRILYSNTTSKEQTKLSIDTRNWVKGVYILEIDFGSGERFTRSLMK